MAAQYLTIMAYRPANHIGKLGVNVPTNGGADERCMFIRILTLVNLVTDGGARLAHCNHLVGAALLK